MSFQEEQESSMDYSNDSDGHRGNDTGYTSELHASTSNATRRIVREQYRKLLASSNENEEEPQDFNRLKEKLNKAKELFTEVNEDMAQEASLDARLLRQLSIVGLRKVEAVITNMVSFEPQDFIERMAKLVSNSGDDEAPDLTTENWTRFGRTTHCLYKSAPVFQYMFGSFPRTPPEQKMRTPRAKQVKETGESKKTAPQKIKEMGKNDQELTTEEVERVLSVLRTTHENYGRKPIGYFEFVCHPSSFSKTIQNIFHISFLVKDGFARLFLNERGMPEIEPVVVERPSDEQSQSQRQDSDAGIVISMTQAEWQEFVKRLRITRPAIP